MDTLLELTTSLTWTLQYYYYYYDYYYYYYYYYYYHYYHNHCYWSHHHSSTTTTIIITTHSSSPKLTTKVCFLGGTEIQSPLLFWTSKPDVSSVTWLRKVTQASLWGPTPGGEGKGGGRREEGGEERRGRVVIVVVVVVVVVAVEVRPQSVIIMTCS